MNKFRCFVASAFLSLVGCEKPNPRVATTLNEASALPGDLPSNPLQWKVITSAMNRRDSTMCILFGNDAAVQYARTNSAHEYPGGSVLSLVSWEQQEDKRWFGGRIPAAPKSVEFVTVAGGADRGRSYAYQDFEGVPLKKVSSEEGSTPGERAAYLLSWRAAVMP